MKLIADSGSTKTDWALMEGTAVVRRFTTQGLNPVHQPAEQLMATLQDELLPQIAGSACRVQSLHFYGAGCTPERGRGLLDVVKRLLPALTEAEVDSDLLAAARAACGHEAGIACILGTGSNSCFYDGARIVERVPPLGYVLGDEGSGAVLGRNLINFLFKGDCPVVLRQAFDDECRLTLADILNKVYREPLPNRFLASLAAFVARHKDDSLMRQLVADNFRAFVDQNLSHYGAAGPVDAVGGIAYEFSDILRQVLEARGYVLRRVLKSPIDGLMAFHAGE